LRHNSNVKHEYARFSSRPKRVSPTVNKHTGPPSK
jgi:hypothetical protein